MIYINIVLFLPNLVSWVLEIPDNIFPNRIYDVQDFNDFKLENPRQHLIPEEWLELDSLKVLNNGIDSQSGSVIGPSYTFTAHNYSEDLEQWVLSDTAKIDSVYLLNQQIRLWQNAIAYNEELKLNAMELDTNISFDGGVGPITRTYSFGETETMSNSWELGISTDNNIDFLSNIAGSKMGSSILISADTRATKIY